MISRYFDERYVDSLCLSIQISRYGGSARHVATPGDGTILSKGSYNRLAMNGKEVYKFATREVPRVINEALDAADMDVEQVDWLLLHQVRSLGIC